MLSYSISLEKVYSRMCSRLMLAVTDVCKAVSFWNRVSRGPGRFVYTCLRLLSNVIDRHSYNEEDLYVQSCTRHIQSRGVDLW